MKGGVFSDIKNFTGAVTGTAYGDATEELELTAQYSDGVISVSIQALLPDEMPYSVLEELSVKEFRLLDSSGRELDASKATLGRLSGTYAVSQIAVGTLPEGEYTLEITALSGCRRADAELHISGSWICEFEV